jgi:predicted component of type VI protein secretion system
MPATINGERVSRIALSSSQVSRFHAVIGTEGDSIVLTDTGSRNGTFVNGVRQTRCVLANGDMLQVGPYAIGISFAVNSLETPSVNSHIFFNPQTNGPDPHWGRKWCRRFLKQVVGENFRRSHFCTLLK